MERIRSLYKKGQEVLLVIIAIILAIMMVLIVTNVITRFIFNFTISWSEELARYLFVQLIFLGACFGINRGSQIRIDLVDHAVENKPKTAALLALIQHVLSLFAAICLMIGGVKLVKVGLTALCPAMQLPMYWWYISIPVGSCFCMLELVLKIIEAADKLKHSGDTQEVSV